MTDAFSPQDPQDVFHFHCSPERPCFNACCRDLQQVLTPHDVLCLKQFLGISSTEFLDRYTEESIGPGTGFPVVSLRFADSAHRACPFVTPEGCRVYAARPGSCRTYPLARGVSRNRKTGVLTEQWVLIREFHCRGFESKVGHTVDTWVADQQIARHNQMNDMLLELISDKNRLHPEPLSLSARRQVYTALYDLDRFRDLLFSAPRSGPSAAFPAAADPACQDDDALLNLAMTWVRQTVFLHPH